MEVAARLAALGRTGAGDWSLDRAPEYFGACPQAGPSALGLKCDVCSVPLLSAARKLVELLRELASAGRCIITTIHQVGCQGCRVVRLRFGQPMGH